MPLTTGPGKFIVKSVLAPGTKQCNDDEVLTKLSRAKLNDV